MFSHIFSLCLYFYSSLFLSSHLSLYIFIIVFPHLPQCLSIFLPCLSITSPFPSIFSSHCFDMFLPLSSNLYSCLSKSSSPLPLSLSPTYLLSFLYDMNLFTCPILINHFPTKLIHWKISSLFIQIKFKQIIMKMLQGIIGDLTLCCLSYRSVVRLSIFAKDMGHGR